MSYQHETQQIQTYTDTNGCYDACVSVCCGAFCTSILIVIMIVLTNWEDEILTSSGSI